MTNEAPTESIEESFAPVTRTHTKETAIDPAVAKFISKSLAQRTLRKAFLEARFQTVGGDATAETWQVWCKGTNGRLVPIVEVTGPRLTLPMGCLREAFKRIGRDVQVVAPKVKERYERGMYGRQKVSALVFTPAFKTEPVAPETTSL